MVRLVGLAEFEGLGIAGFLRDVKLVPCEKPQGWMKLVGATVEGEEVATKCIEPDAAKRLYAVVSSYLKRWGGLVEEG
ncbi:MAG: hypothetical protein F7B17_08615 [Desulfurococcales archaeon]|nr:hypothetical protein [Desulfurococcales archaeon]